MGGKIDHEINKYGGPYTFRINGQNYHFLGSLVPLDGRKAKFAQLYIHDTPNEISNILGMFNNDDGSSPLEEEVVRDLIRMFDEHNVLVQSFRMARDKHQEDGIRDFKLRLISKKVTDGRQYNLPSSSEVATLLVDQYTNEEECHRDIVIEHKKTGLQRITEIHPSFMALQYPLLFSYGEDGFRTGISHFNRRIGRSGLSDAINQGDVMADNVGKMIILASSYTGGPRYRVQNYQSENDYMLEDIEGQKSDDRLDILATQVDEIISAKIPDKENDPVDYSVVDRFMVHGPCGILNHNSPCMINGKCSKQYPKKFHDSTSFDNDGFPIYMRRGNGRYILKNGLQLDNRHVVPYNRNLLVKYDAHLNVELCNRSRSVKYLFKYINKGPDCATALILDEQNFASTSETRIQEHDEIKAYLDCRYISTAEAAWRIYQFDMFYREPIVEHLSFHLPDQQPIYFQGHMTLDNIMSRSRIETTMFTELMKVNSEDIEARQLTYSEFPTKYVWNKKEKLWTRRRRCRCIGRMYYMPPTAGEKYYLRMLLNMVRGSCSYEQIRTIDGIVYDTFKDTCYALGLLEDDKEWDDCLKEASMWGTENQLCQLFSTILVHCEVVDPCHLWESNWKLLSEDILYKQRRLLDLPNLQLTDEQLQNYSLLEIEQILRKMEKSLEDFSGMPIPNDTLMSQMNSRLIFQELNYDKICTMNMFNYYVV
ncbi:uncharacterized protein [Arachis hypogaea]|uniref:uncharacterized protein n=1 Tax=Arachis hypogaea TaxID=3818 RepID=UPI000DECB3F7